jgi:hypothetical protein
LETSRVDWDGIASQFPPGSIYHMLLTQLAFQVPHGVQHSMSAESMPVLSSAVAIFEIFMSEWEDLAKDYPKLLPWIRVGLVWAKKYYKLMDDTDAYMVTMGEVFILSHHDLTLDLHL